MNLRPYRAFGLKTKTEINCSEFKNAFLFYWTNQDSKYPSFIKLLRPRCGKYFALFEKFLREGVGVQNLQIVRCESTHVNLIQLCDYWREPTVSPQIAPPFVLLRWDADKLALTPLTVYINTLLQQIDIYMLRSEPLKQLVYPHDLGSFLNSERSEMQEAFQSRMRTYGINSLTAK